MAKYRAMNAPESISRKAFAKVNLALRILGKRQDGYHEVSTVMTPVSVYDVLTFQPGGEGLSVVCPGMPDLLHDDNLVTKAARAVFDVSGTSLGLRITVEKHIPAGAGMGGGSSDAAAAILVVNDLLPEDKRIRPGRLLKVAGSVGADVPFFLGCNSVPSAWSEAVCTGIGDEVRPLGALKTFWLVAAFPRFGVNTTQAYKDWDLLGGAASLGEGGEKVVLSALESGDPMELASGLVNDLEKPVSLRHPLILRIKERLLASGALGASMTGSGSAVYGICSSREHAESVRLSMEKLRPELGLEDLIVLRTGCDM